jgi:hypothetical protein
VRSSATTLGAAILLGSTGLALAGGNPDAAPAVVKVQAAAMSDAQIKQKLESEGYANVRITEHDKDHVDATATKNGKPEKLAVNPQTGQVMPADTDEDND